MKVSWFRVSMSLRKHGVTVMLVAQSFLTVTLLCFLQQSDVILCGYYKEKSSSKAIDLTRIQNSASKPVQKSDYTSMNFGDKLSLKNTAGKEILVSFHNKTNPSNFSNKNKQEQEEIHDEENEDVYINDEHEDSFKDNEQQEKNNDEGTSEDDDEDSQDEEAIIEEAIQHIQEHQDDEIIIEQPVEDKLKEGNQQQIENQQQIKEKQEPIEEKQQEVVPIVETPLDETRDIEKEELPVNDVRNKNILLSKHHEKPENEAFLESYPKDFAKHLPKFFKVGGKEPKLEDVAALKRISKGIEDQSKEESVVREEKANVGQRKDVGNSHKPNQQQLPSLYKAYSRDIISSGLTYQGYQFFLNGLPFRIMSGAIHYFRVHEDYWRDRLKKLRAAGLNTVETYIAWNLHEESRGNLDFETEGKNLRKFLSLAKEEDLLVILRPGPYICAEWEYGGIPSWILRNESVKVRSTHPAYLEPALRYLRTLANNIKHLQWSKQFGPQPIIGVQVENEYPIFADSADIGRNYITILKKEMEKSGLNQGMFFVSNPIRQVGPHALFPDILQTINFGNLPVDRLKELKSLQPNKPLMVMEFWTGWFDNWLEPHKKFEVYMFKKNMQEILMANASFNLYMFHGGTNFGFMNGAYVKKDKVSYRPVVSSYDYDAILSESGSYTSKYYALKTLLEQYSSGVKTFTPEPPQETKKVAYLPAHVRYYYPLQDILNSLSGSKQAGSHVSGPVPMEMLDRIGLLSQNYGYILYRRRSVFLRRKNVLRIKGSVKDMLYILLDGKLISKPLAPQDLGTYPPYFGLKDPKINIEGIGKFYQLDLLVENAGRMNVGGIHQERKGIMGRVFLNDVLLQDWAVFPLEFKNDMFPSQEKWLPYPPPNNVEIVAPALYKAEFDVPEDAVRDTFINLSQDNWTKGQIFVNNFNLGRYWNLGPTKTSYVPAPILNKGKNQIYIFELFEPGRKIMFDDHPTLG